MKIAFIHCRIMPWWALEVFKDLMSQKFHEHPNLDARVFTLFSDEKELIIDAWALHPKHITITHALPSWINQLFLFCSQRKIRWLSAIFDYRNLMFFYIPLMKMLSCKIKRYKPQEIVISSFAVAKNITPISGVPMTLYLHSPMQYIRSHFAEYDQKIRWWKKRFFSFIVPQLKKWDMRYTKFDKVYVNSEYTAKLAQELYGMRSQVMYPKLDQAFWTTDPVIIPASYHLFVGRLVNFVREAHVVINLFNRLGLPLVMMGSGPDEVYLKSIAKENIIFTGWITDMQEKVDIIKQAKWLINLTKESFGMNTVEALLLGVPVFGYNGGMTADLVDKDCGMLIDDKSDMADMVEQFRQFDRKEWNRRQISIHMRRKLGGGK